MRSPDRSSHIWTRWLFLRALGVIYLVAFISLWTQIDGLAGKNGIMPAAQLVQAMGTHFDQQGVGLDRYRLAPTLCWFSASNASLHFQCAAGAVLSILVMVGIFPAPSLFLLWALYLSLATVCGVFLGYQWDNLLLETGFLAIFIAPGRILPRPSLEHPPSPVIWWLFRWLLFRLMFASGCVKLVSGDPAWRTLTALNYHYETQPLPSWLGWYAHQLPGWFQKSSVVLMFAVELVAPFFIFLPRRWRLAAAGAFVGLQVLIALTGNYCFFNLLAVALCLFLLDDAVLQKLLPARFCKTAFAAADPEQKPTMSPQDSGAPPLPTRPRVLEISRRIIVAGVAVVIWMVTLVEMLGLFHVAVPRWTPMIKLYSAIAPFRSVNGYGLFAVMTTSRLEIVMEGSNDGQTWSSYEFKYKPGYLKERPRFVAPHQPRLDWQMWFEALHDPGGSQRSPWFLNFCVRLLQGSPEVLALMAQNPFPKAPPQFVRAAIYDYHFTDLATRREEGRWWRREFKGYYLPPISLRAVKGE